jgi:hypothetical protein
MNPLDHFEFSQSSLQDYIDCRRRFQLRFIQRVIWPAVQAEPVRENERHIQRGDRFHRLAQQYLLGISAEKLARMAAADEDENLQSWWENFTGTLPEQIDGEKHVEVTLAAPLGNFQLVAKYDLVLMRPGGAATIFDWKTSTHRPKRTWLRERLQTRVYPYLLVQAGGVFNQGKPLAPEQVEMVYWFTEPGQAPEHFAYSNEQYAADRQYLLDLVGELQSLRQEQFEMCSSEATCRFCVYRSLCSRGVQAGSLADGEDEPDYPGDSPNALDFNLEQIGEISF